jgi:hypothetical protein
MLATNCYETAEFISAERLLPWYDAATAVFMLVDYGFGINVRVAFLEPWPEARAAYYGICFACLGLMAWRPGWAALIGTFESLVTLAALIISMAIRVMIPSDAIFSENASIVSIQEIANFLIAGTVAYLAWVNGIRSIKIR